MCGSHQSPCLHETLVTALFLQRTGLIHQSCCLALDSLGNRLHNAQNLYYVLHTAYKCLYKRLHKCTNGWLGIHRFYSKNLLNHNKNLVHSYKITHKTKKIIEIFMQTFIIKLSTVRRENRTKTDLNYISRRTYL